MGPSGLDRRTSIVRSSVRSHDFAGSQPSVPRHHHCRPPALFAPFWHALRGRSGRMHSLGVARRWRSQQRRRRRASCPSLCVASCATGWCAWPSTLPRWPRSGSCLARLERERCGSAYAESRRAPRPPRHFSSPRVRLVVPQDTAGKAVAIWLPISAFVAMGLEHSVANMFIIPVSAN